LPVARSTSCTVQYSAEVSPSSGCSGGRTCAAANRGQANPQHNNATNTHRSNLTVDLRIFQDRQISKQFRLQL
jgi:hypothetical protein